MRPTLFLLLLAGTRAALRVGFARAPVLLMCSPSEEPIVNRETLARIQSELYRTEETDREALVREQSDLIRSLLSDISAALPETKVDMGGDAVVNGERTDADVVGLPAEEAGISLAEIDGSLNAVVGPHLPVLLGASFPMAARDVLVQLRSEEERTALLALSRFVMGVQAEVGGALQELQWRQQQKLRELCDAASEGGTERLVELAEAMRDELDTDFCNYLNYAIEQEEVKLEAEGAKPFEPPLPPYAGGGAASLPPEYQKELEEEEQAARLEAAQIEQQRGLKAGASTTSIGAGGVEGVEVVSDARGGEGAAEDGGASGQTPASNAWALLVDGVDVPWGEAEEGGEEEEQAAASTVSTSESAESRTTAQEAKQGRVEAAAEEAQSSPRAARPTAEAEGSASASVGGQLSTGMQSVEAQQWLLVLRLVRQGVYSMLAKDYRDDVKHLRYIIGLNSPEAREQLTRSTLLAMTEEQQQHFDATVDRITANLSVQRNARDLELYTKVCEVRSYIESYNSDFGATGMGEFTQM